MAVTITKRIIKEFNLEDALAGGKIVFVNNPTESIDKIEERHITDYVEYFKATDSTNKASRYQGTVGNTTYFFDEKGRPSDNIPEHRLFSVDAQIKTSQGTVATKGDSTSRTEVNIVALQPREQFAMAAMQGILQNISSPLLMSNALILDLVNTSFNIANAMMQKAADVRAELKGDQNTNPDREEEIKVNPKELTNDTDKILYNLNENMYKLVDKSTKGIAIVPTKEAVFKIASSNGQAFDVNIASSSITVPTRITNSSITTYVSNMPSVPTEPVSITGTVSVDNFPSSGT